MSAIIGVIFSFVLITAIAFYSFEMSSYFSPKYRSLDNKVFKESEQYNDGMIRDLENLMYDYKTADTDDKKRTIKSLARHRFSVYPKNKLSSEQIEFLNN